MFSYWTYFLFWIQLFHYFLYTFESCVFNKNLSISVKLSKFCHRICDFLSLVFPNVCDSEVHVLFFIPNIALHLLKNQGTIDFISLFNKPNLTLLILSILCLISLSFISTLIFNIQVFPSESWVYFNVAIGDVFIIS